MGRAGYTGWAGLVLPDGLDSSAGQAGLALPDGPGWLCRMVRMGVPYVSGLALPNGLGWLCQMLRVDFAKWAALTLPDGPGGIAERSGGIPVCNRCMHYKCAIRGCTVCHECMQYVFMYYDLCMSAQCAMHACTVCHACMDRVPGMHALLPCMHALCTMYKSTGMPCMHACMHALCAMHAWTVCRACMYWCAVHACTVHHV
jgi:hypothetical protein